MKRSNIVLSLLGAFGALAAAMAEDGPTRKPEREELWVPSDRLDAVLKEFPKAVMLTPEQYETLVRDAGKLKSALPIDPAIPEGLIIEGLTLTGKAESLSDEVILAGELTVRASREGWSKGNLAWPFVMQSLTVEGGTLLAHLGDVVSAKGSSFRPMELFARGPGVMRLRFTTSLRVFDQWSEGVRTLDIPEVKSSGRLVLTLPAASTVLRSSAHEHSGQVVTAAFDHVAWADEASFVPKDLPRAVRLRWSDALPEAEQASVRFLEKGRVSIKVEEAGVSVSLTARMVLQAGAGRVEEMRWPLREKGTQVTAVTGAAVRDWHQDGQTLVMKIERTGAPTDVAIQMRGSGGIDAMQSAALELAIPTVVPPVPLSAEAEFELSEDLELLDLRGGRQIDAGHLAFQLGIDAPSVLVRTSKPRIEAVVDALVTLDRDSVMINRTLVLQADRPLSNTRVTLPDGEEFVSINASAGPALKWKRVQQTLELRWQEPIPLNAGASMVLVSRKKLAKAWSGQGIAEPVLVENIRVPEAVKVTGYTALAFDDAWRVRLGTLSGLEDRDVKYSPVTGGRMAWFGLRDWSLNFEAERAGSVYAAVITAYALPRARTVEIEGQVELEISGAPLREFKFKLPPAVAALLRVTSPSVGEQKLDEATGVWTCTLIRESTGRQNIRFRISLPAEISGLEGATTVKTIAAVLPRLEMPEARRFRGTWVVEANTDTQLAFVAKSLQPLDVLRAPTVEGYAPRHRIVGAYTFGTAEHELKLTAERHAHSELAALIVMQLQMNSVLGRDGNALHSALLNLRHSGEQFVTLVLPEGAELLSTVVNGAAVKPVRSQDTAIAIPLPSESANQPNVAVRVQFQLPAAAWTGSGALKVAPVRLPGNVPILSTSWGIDVPEGYTYAKPETRLEAKGFDGTETLWGRLRQSLVSETWLLGRDRLFASVDELKFSRDGDDRSIPVSRLLELGQSQIDLGLYDVAFDTFRDALRLDPYNVPARRALEEVDQKRRMYSETPRDHTRSRMLNKAGKAWEDYPSNADQLVASLEVPRSASATLQDKMDRIIFPSVQFSGASVEEAIEFLRMKCRDLDIQESDPAKKGVSFILKTGDAPSTAKISLDLKDVPMSEALRYVTELAGMKYKIEPYAVLVVPISETETEMVQRVYRVPPDFLTQSGEVSNLDSAPADPFATGTATSGASLLRRPSATEIFKAQGIQFPPGGSAVFNPTTGELIVRNTAANLDLVDAYVGGKVHSSSEAPKVIDRMQFRLDSPAAAGGRFADETSRTLDSTVFPAFSFSGASLEECVEFFRKVVPSVQWEIASNVADSAQQLNLDLKDVPAKEALRYVVELAGTKYKIDGTKVIIGPLPETNTTMETRRYQMPWGWVSGLKDRHSNPVDELKNPWIPFPDRSAATLAGNVLSVTNTVPNLDLLEDYLEAIWNRSDETPPRLAPGSEFKAESANRAGLLPLLIDLPEQGRRLFLSGFQEPEVVEIRYVAWETQLFRAMFGIGLGVLLFWGLGRRRWFLATLLVVVVAGFGAPLLAGDGLLAWVNAVLLGWLVGLGLAVLAWILGAAARRAKIRPLQSATAALCLSGIFAPPSTHADEVNAAIADPAAHVVIVPYEPGRLPNGGKGQRYYMPYESFERLWAAAKESRRPTPLLAEDQQQGAVIHSAHYAAVAEENGLTLHARLEVVSRGRWSPLEIILGGVQKGIGKQEPVALRGLIGEVVLDGRSAALHEDKLSLDQPGKHHIEFTATLPVAGRWQRLDLQFPPSMATALTLQLREGDGWLWAEGLPARAGDGRGSFAVPVGAGGAVSLERTAGAQSLGEGPVPTAEALTNLLLREWQNVAVQGRVKFSFPGASRQTLTLATDRDLRLGVVVIKADVIGTQRSIPIARVESQLRGDRIERVFHLAAAITDEAVLEFEAETTSSDHAPQIIPGARRSKEVVAIFHDESREIKVDPAAAERLGRDEPARDGLKFAGAFQSRSAAPVAYQATLAPEFAEAEVNYVFQLSGQKCEMVAALSMGRSRGTWTHAEMGLPTGYEVQSISGPAVQGWAVEKGRLHLRLDPTQAGRDARVVVHLAIGTEAPVTTWRLEPLKLEGFRDVRGRAVIAVHAATQVRLGDLSAQREVEELDATLPDPVIEGLFNIALPFEKKRALRFGHADWTTQVTMTQEVARYAVDTVALVRASDEGIRLSQQIAIGVEQGSLRSVAVRLPAALPEAVVTGPQLREISTRVEGDERVYDCAFQSDVLGHETLTFDHDLPLAAEVTVPFVKVAGAARLQRFFVLDNRSSRESRVVDSTGLSTAARETVPYLPGDLARPQFFRALGDGQLRIAYEELSMTEANAATVSLAALTTMLRNDGGRWEVVEYSLINRSLQFLAVVLPAQAELISTSVSGTPVRADERLTEGKKVRLVPLIHTQVGQRALEVRLVYRFPKSVGGDWKNLRLDDPELQGLSVERTTWTVWSPKDRTVAKPGGNMDVVTASDLVNEGKLAALSVIADINQQVAAGKLDDDQAAVALEGAEQWLGELSKEGERDQSYGRADEPLSKQKVAEEWGRQQQMLTENRMSRVQVAGKKKVDAATATAGKDKNQTSWATNGALNKAGDGQLVLTGANTFTGDTSAVAFNDNVGVSQGFFNNGRQQSDQSAAIIAGTWAVTASNARGNNMALQERGRQVTVRAGTLLQNSAAASTVAGTSGSAASMNANGVVAMNGGVVQLQQGTGGVGGVNTYTGATIVSAGALINSNGFDLAGTGTATTGSGIVLDGGQLSASGQPTADGLVMNGGTLTLSGTVSGSATTHPADPFASGPATVPLSRPEADALSAIPKALGVPAAGAFANLNSPAPAPAMAADPFGGRPTTSAKPETLGDIAQREIVPGSNRGAKPAAPVIPALQTAALRPTGRHALPVELPVDGVALHFVKLKDNAVVELQLSTPWPAEKLASLIGLASGLLVCGLMAWVGRRWRL